MSSVAFKPDMAAIFGERVDQNPDPFNMAIPAARKIPTQRMIFKLRRQPIPGNQQIKNRLQLFQILAPPLGQFNVLFELRCAAEGPHKPRSA